MSNHPDVQSTHTPGVTFPLPDVLCGAAERELVDIAQFASSCLPEPPAPMSSTHDSSCMHASDPNCAPLSILSNTLASLEPVPLVPTTERCKTGRRSAPLLCDITQLTRREPQHADLCEVTIAVYDSEAPTKSLEVVYNADEPLTRFVDHVPCTYLEACIPNANKRAPTQSFLYIEGVIYCDTRFGDADCCAPVKKFLDERGKRTTVVDMVKARTKLRELKVKLGFPYVFLHNGSCEHLFIVRDVTKRAHLSGQEPFKVVWKRAPRVRPCDVCQVRYAEKFVFGDRLAESSPFHYCEQCYRRAHYDSNGHLYRNSGSFQVFSHPSPTL